MLYFLRGIRGSFTRQNSNCAQLSQRSHTCLCVCCKEASLFISSLLKKSYHVRLDERHVRHVNSGAEDSRDTGLQVLAGRTGVLHIQIIQILAGRTGVLHIQIRQVLTGRTGNIHGYLFYMFCVPLLTKKELSLSCKASRRALTTPSLTSECDSAVQLVKRAGTEHNRILTTNIFLNTGRRDRIGNR